MGKVGGIQARLLRAALRARREELGLNIRQAAVLVGRELRDRTGLSYQALSKWENDASQPRIDQFAAWARAMGMRLDIQLLDPNDGRVALQLSPRVIPSARALEVLSDADLAMVEDMIRRLSERGT